MTRPEPDPRDVSVIHVHQWTATSYGADPDHPTACTCGAWSGTQWEHAEHLAQELAHDRDAAELIVVELEDAWLLAGGESRYSRDDDPSVATTELEAARARTIAAAYAQIVRGRIVRTPEELAQYDADDAELIERLFPPGWDQPKP